MTGTDDAHRPTAARTLANTGLRAVADIGGKLGSAVLYILLARAVGVTDYGVYMFALSYTALVLTGGALGQDIVLMRRLAQEPERLDEYLSDALMSRLLFCVPPLLLGTLIAGHTGFPPSTQLVVFVVGLGAIVEMQLRIIYAVFQAFDRLAPVPLILIVQRWSVTLVAGAALLGGAGIVTVAGIYLAGCLLGLLLAISLVRRMFGRPSLRPTATGWWRVTRESIPIGIAYIAGDLYFRIDMTMLAAMRGPEDVGQYAAAYRLLETTLFVTWSVNAAVLPVMSRLTRASTPPVGAVYQRALKLVLAVTLPMAVAAAVVGPALVPALYGDGYSPAGPVIALLAPTIALFPLSAMTSTLLYTQGLQRRVLIAYVVILSENVLVNLLVLPRYGAQGAAITTSTSEVLVAGMLIATSAHLHGRFDLRRIALGPGVGAAVSAAVMFAIRDSLLLASATGTATYLLTLLLVERRAFPDDYAIVSRLRERLQSQYQSRRRTRGGSLTHVTRVPRSRSETSP